MKVVNVWLMIVFSAIGVIHPVYAATPLPPIRKSSLQKYEGFIQLIPLLSLVKEENLESLQFFLSNSLSSSGSPRKLFNINELDEQKDTPLIWAIRRQNIPIIKLLLDYPFIDINHKNKSGYTALHVAVYVGSKEVVQLLLSEEKLYPNEKNIIGYAPLHYAALMNLHEIIDILMQDPRVTINIRNDQAKTPHCLIPQDPIESKTGKNTDFRQQVFSRYMIDYSIDMWIDWEIRKTMPCPEDDELNSLITLIQSKIQDFLIPNYVDDVFIKKMIIARYSGLTPICVIK